MIAWSPFTSRRRTADDVGAPSDGGTAKFYISGVMRGGVRRRLMARWRDGDDDDDDDDARAEDEHQARFENAARRDAMVT